jgi:hypothetical protein
MGGSGARGVRAEMDAMPCKAQEQLHLHMMCYDVPG